MWTFHLKFNSHNLKPPFSILKFDFHKFCKYFVLQTDPQDIVEENAVLVHKLWIEAKGSVYVCGKVAQPDHLNI